MEIDDDIAIIKYWTWTVKVNPSRSKKTLIQ